MSLFENPAVQDASLEELLQNLARQTDAFEGYPHPHASRIAVISEELAKAFNLGSHDRQSLRHAALVHDLGELVMNRDYIKRNGMLTEEERLDMMRHPVIGEQESSRRGLSRAVQLLVRWHQEWWNGEGYPDGLRREQIPLGARILRLADTYVALTDTRPYSPAIPAAEAKKYIIQWAGLAFDPQVVRAFLALPEIDAMKSYGERDSS